MSDLSPVDVNSKNPFEQQTVIQILTRLPNDFTDEHREHLKKDHVSKLAIYIFDNIIKNKTYLIKLGEAEELSFDYTDYTAGCVVQPIGSGNTAAYLEAFGLLTTLYPTLEMGGEPVEMANEIVRYISEKIAALEAQIPQPEPARYKYDEAPPIGGTFDPAGSDIQDTLIENLKTKKENRDA